MDHQLKTVDIYNQYVKEYEEKFMLFDLYNDTFDALLNVLPITESILELGCGPGNVINYFLNKRKDLIITGVDLAAEMLKRGKEINPSADFILEDIRNLNAFTKQYHAVVELFVFHIYRTQILTNSFKISADSQKKMDTCI